MKIIDAPSRETAVLPAGVGFLWSAPRVPSLVPLEAVPAHLMLSTCVPDQTYCDRLVQDTPFLTGQGRLSEQQVDRIILQLNRYYPQILTNKEAEKVPRGEQDQGPPWELAGVTPGLGPVHVVSNHQIFMPQSQMSLW
jgi:hypothetical protein